jgi:hypothetical protein
MLIKIALNTCLKRLKVVNLCVFKSYIKMIKVELRTFAQDENKNECIAAKRLKCILEEDLKKYPNAKGNIYILSSVRIFGQKRDDIDILVMGFAEGLILKNLNTKNMGLVKDLQIKSFICNIELKSHDARFIRKEGSNYIVKYKGVDHPASEQCREAKFSLVNYLNDQLDINRLFAADLLWFDSLNKESLEKIKGGVADNAMSNTFNFRELIDSILLQVEVRGDYSGISLNSFADGKNQYNKIVKLFTTKREAQGLTRQKFELLNQVPEEIQRLLTSVGKKLTIVTGRAGTGKTVQLLQLAFHLASEERANRCLILTYNNALVSDIKRLIDYTPMPTKVDGRTVAIKTIHSFFHSLIKGLGVIKENLNPYSSDYESKYNEALVKLYDYVVKECKKEDVETLKDLSEIPIDWDYILIDEAQDFSDLEKDILFKLYGLNRLIVADGVDQFIRSSKRQDWGENIKRDSIHRPQEMVLERRQKSNLVKFVNAFAKKSNVEWELKPNDKLLGGTIKVCSKFSYGEYKILKENCEENGCENYDILLLAPPSMVAKDENNNRSFSKCNDYKKGNIPIFDGIDNRSRTTYPTKDQCRVYQYDSCRGLEGWCVVCLRFDELIEYKMNTYKMTGEELGLDEDKAKLRNVLLWALMPLTRPIDTLIIVLKNKDSLVGKMLKELSESYDFIEWSFE